MLANELTEPQTEKKELPSFSASIRELLTIAIPLAISAGSVTMMHIANRLFLTWHSQDALAAVLPASMWNWTLLSIFIGTAQYVNTFVSQYKGPNVPIAWPLPSGRGLTLLSLVAYC